MGKAHKKGFYEKIIKRMADILLSGMALVLLFPAILLLCIFVRMKLGKPVFFRQERPGKGERIFTLIKFRTMTDERDEKGELLPDALRLTKFGKFLRSTSLDELPELWNILVGDMSFVGPRPLLVKYLPLYSEAQRRRHAVLPGLTGWAQVNGRNSITWDEKFAYDLWYVDHIGFRTDAKILLMTIKKVLIREGISSVEAATAEEFRGA